MIKTYFLANCDETILITVGTGTDTDTFLFSTASVSRFLPHYNTNFLINTGSRVQQNNTNKSFLNFQHSPSHLHDSMMSDLR